MKKFLLIFAFLGLFTLVAPKVATAEQPCATVTMACPDGITHIIVICDYEDIIAWAEILCGLGTAE
jgi:hypothetical protein